MVRGCEGHGCWGEAVRVIFVIRACEGHGCGGGL